MKCVGICGVGNKRIPMDFKNDSLETSLILDMSIPGTSSLMGTVF